MDSNDQGAEGIRTRGGEGRVAPTNRAMQTSEHMAFQLPLNHKYNYRPDRPSSDIQFSGVCCVQSLSRAAEIFQLPSLSRIFPVVWGLLIAEIIGVKFLRCFMSSVVRVESRGLCRCANIKPGKLSSERIADMALVRLREN